MGSKQSLSSSFHMPSPLRVEGNEFEATVALIDKGVPLAGIGVTNMPIMGLNAPVFPVGAFIQSMAEVIGGFMVIKLLASERRIPVSFSVNVYAFDMKTSSLAYGSPEHNLIDLMQLAVNRYYGRNVPGGRFIRTMAKRPGIQAAAESAASAVIGALAGVKCFSGAGLIALDEIFSPEHLVISCEIRDYAQRVRDGFEWTSESKVESLIDEVALSIIFRIRQLRKIIARCIGCRRYLTGPCSRSGSISRNRSCLKKPGQLFGNA